MDAAARFHLEGAVNGSYVRVVFQGLPCEFVNCFDPAHPLVRHALMLCFLQSTETTPIPASLAALMY
jgi:hypothetical protein